MDDPKPPEAIKTPLKTPKSLATKQTGKKTTAVKTGTKGIVSTKVVIISAATVVVLGGIAGAIYAVVFDGSTPICSKLKSGENVTLDAADLNYCTMLDCNFDPSQCSFPCPLGYHAKAGICPTNCYCSTKGVHAGDMSFDAEMIPGLMKRYGILGRDGGSIGLFSSVAERRLNNWWDSKKPNGRYRIPYQVNPNVGERAMLQLQEGFKKLSNLTCIDFESWQFDSNDVIFSSGDLCTSFTGKHKKSQEVKLNPLCNKAGTIEHLLMHVLGFSHEHNHPNRDDYIEIIPENIQVGMMRHFMKYSEDSVLKLGTSYNMESLMHFHSYAYAADFLNPTILNRETDEPIENIVTTYANSDIAGLNELFKCPGGGAPTSIEELKENGFYGNSGVTLSNEKKSATTTSYFQANTTLTSAVTNTTASPLPTNLTETMTTTQKVTAGVDETTTQKVVEVEKTSKSVNEATTPVTANQITTKQVTDAASTTKTTTKVIVTTKTTTPATTKAIVTTKITPPATTKAVVTTPPAPEPEKLPSSVGECDTRRKAKSSFQSQSSDVISIEPPISNVNNSDSEKSSVPSGRLEQWTSGESTLTDYKKLKEISEQGWVNKSDAKKALTLAFLIVNNLKPDASGLDYSATESNSKCPPDKAKSEGTDVWSNGGNKVVAGTNGTSTTQEPTTTAATKPPETVDSQFPWSHWESWTICLRSCGVSPPMKRYRWCKLDRKPCVGKFYQARPCPVLAPCPQVWNTWGPWGEYGTCSKSCGLGLQIKKRVCPESNPCSSLADDEVSAKYCTVTDCAAKLKAKWSTWTPFYDCTKSCGSGIQARVRICWEDKAARKASSLCPGTVTEIRKCNTIDCSIANKKASEKPTTAGPNLTGVGEATTKPNTNGVGSPGSNNTTTKPDPSVVGGNATAKPDSNVVGDNATAKPDSGGVVSPGSEEATAKPDSGVVVSPGSEEATAIPDSGGVVSPGSEEATAIPDSGGVVSPGSEEATAKPDSEDGETSVTTGSSEDKTNKRIFSRKKTSVNNPCPNIDDETEFIFGTFSKDLTVDVMCGRKLGSQQWKIKVARDKNNWLSQNGPVVSDFLMNECSPFMKHLGDVNADGLHDIICNSLEDKALIVKLMYNEIRNTTKSGLFCEKKDEAMFVLDANGDDKADIMCKYPGSQNYGMVFSVHRSSKTYNKKDILELV